MVDSERGTCSGRQAWFVVPLPLLPAGPLQGHQNQPSRLDTSTRDVKLGSTARSPHDDTSWNSSSSSSPVSLPPAFSIVGSYTRRGTYCATHWADFSLRKQPAHTIASSLQLHDRSDAISQLSDQGQRPSASSTPPLPANHLDAPLLPSQAPCHSPKASPGPPSSSSPTPLHPVPFLSRTCPLPLRSLSTAARDTRRTRSRRKGPRRQRSEWPERSVLGAALRRQAGHESYGTEESKPSLGSWRGKHRGSGR